MKNRVIIFLGSLFIASSFLSSCSSDDNKSQVPTTSVVTSKQYTDIESANKNINTIVEDVFTAESRTRKSSDTNHQLPDCVKITSEITDQNKTVTIDFGDKCKLSNGEVISGSIRMSFDIKVDTESEIKISYDLDKVVYKDITVSGTATKIFSFKNDTGNTKFTTNSNFSFAWEDKLTATSKTNFITESFLEKNTTDTPEEIKYYKLTTGNSETKFSNGDQYSTEITTPLRNETNCLYIVSGVIVTKKNKDTITLNYGDGKCDAIATQTDADGKETTIEL
ncbi:hypothetical protein [Aquimarina longa]|uniref:hypothetical protein n=1 Tax=Aquimarina longa TaxID=1080221 RepID=UPI0007862B95|nr:hypothetical protein [Aquimarina longa]